MHWSDTPDLTEHCVQSERLLDGRFLQVQRDTVTLASGAESYREYCIHPGAVMVIPVLDSTDAANPVVVMERQYRYPVGLHLLEFPAGKLDAGESELHCAQRELAEETGYRAKSWAHLGDVHPCIAYSTEKISIWLAKDLSAGAQALDADELLSVFPMSQSDLRQCFLQGQLSDAKTIAGLAWLTEYVQGHLHPVWQSVVMDGAP